MSTYSGPQGPGAARRHHADKRAAAEIRAARHCPSGKRRYLDEHEARCELVGAFIGRNRGHAERRECRVYLCPRCAGFHLTSKPYRARPAVSA